MFAFVTRAGRIVNRSFKAFERYVSRRVDKATRILQPVFLALAVGLIALCAFCFFEAVFPEVFLAADVPRWKRVLGTAWCSYLVSMLSFNYFMAVVTHPGSPSDPPRRLPKPQPIPIVGPFLLHLITRSSVRPAASHPRGLRAAALREVRAAQEKERQRQDERLTSDSRAEASMAAQSEANAVSANRADRYARSCKKCPPIAGGARPPKPERTHHCSVCETCILKFDHHCPWIKGCVGLHNERYFLLFLCYFSVASLFAAYWGLRPALRCLNFISGEWSHRTPRVLMLLTEVLSLVMGLAVLVMCLSQMHLIAHNQTNVESNDNEWYRKVALSRGRTFLNPYDQGRLLNFCDFFNIGLAGDEGRYHWMSVLLPVAIPPASDGWTWKKRRNWRDHSMEAQDQLTDEEEPSTDEDVNERGI